jgi:hypothetical protein
MTGGGCCGKIGPSYRSEGRRMLVVDIIGGMALNGWLEPLTSFYWEMIL